MISLLSLLVQAATPATAVAPWTVNQRPNPNPAITSTVTGTPSADNNAKLVLRCDAGPEKVVSIQFFTRTSLGGPPNRSVMVTVDGGTPMGANWVFVPQGAYIGEDATVTTLAAAIAAGKSIKVHTTTTVGEPVDATFAGPPSADPVTKLLAACDYTLGIAPVRTPAPAPTPNK